MTYSVTPEIECPDCDGYGKARIAFIGSPDCPACHGEGWRPMNDDELADAAERQEQDRIEGEPPVTLAEQHRAAWEQKHT